MNRLIPLLLALVLASVASQTLAQEQDYPNVNELPVKQSMQGVYTLAARPSLQPVRLNAMHYWVLQLTDADNAAVSNARFKIDGGMPGHGHGLPTSPAIVPGDAPGEYVLRGLRFNMSGIWELRLEIDDGDRSDKLQLLFVVEDTTGN
ncbi:MAG: FixH family protein [Gammaproteobacteria bacterium]|nr:FixH family protein [Gammaproteobacteria bacterium]NND60091.1 Auxin-binding protein [Gammaproteobacteria bacterium]